MKLPYVKDFDFKDKNVLLRTNYDVPLKAQKAKGKRQKLQIEDTRRIDESIPTIRYLLKHKAKKIIIISHLGRPEGRQVKELSLAPVADYLNKQIGSKVEKTKTEIFVRENLRFEADEEKNDNHFAAHLSEGMDIFVNDAFACCHRPHASIVAINKYLPGCFGLDAYQEITTLSGVAKHPQRPLVVIIGGVKDDKLKIAEKLSGWADYFLIGGGLPKLIGKAKFGGKRGNKYDNWVVAKLTSSGKDITKQSAKEFVRIISQAKTIIWAGPMGQYEVKKFQTSTKIVALAVAQSKAFSVVGGGDTENALSQLNLARSINYISSGGGAMMEFLANGSLIGIESIVNSKK